MGRFSIQTQLHHPDYQSGKGKKVYKGD